jgi:hypothetical protein
VDQSRLAVFALVVVVTVVVAARLARSGRAGARAPLVPVMHLAIVILAAVTVLVIGIRLDLDPLGHHPTRRGRGGGGVQHALDLDRRRAGRDVTQQGDRRAADDRRQLARPPVTPLNSNFPLLFVIVLSTGAPLHVSCTVTPTAGVPVAASAVPTSMSSACVSQLRSSPDSPSATATPGPLLIVPRTVCPWALLPAEEPVLFELDPQPAMTTRATAATVHAPNLACHRRLSIRSPLNV